MSLTGRFNFRKTWRGKLTLELEELVSSRWGGEKHRWRSAKLIDLAEPEMRALIDLRFKPQYMARTSARSEQTGVSISEVALPSDVTRLADIRAEKQLSDPSKEKSSAPGGERG